MTRLAGRHVLLVEDEAFIGMHIEDLLIDAGAQVVGPAQTVALALMMLANEHIDAAVLDLNLEGRSAASVGAALDQLQIPFVVVTGNAGAAALAGLSMAPILAKPFDPDQLITILAVLLAARTPPDAGEANRVLRAK